MAEALREGRRQRAIAAIEECRQIHVQWAEFQESNPDWEDMTEPGDVGDSAHHREWVAKYDEVLAVLRGDDAE